MPDENKNPEQNHDQRLKELKVMAYDLLAAKESADRQLASINAEIQKLHQQKLPTKDKG